MKLLASALLLICLIPVVVYADDDGHDHDHPHTVDCTRGDSVVRALTHARPGDTLVIKGTCSENVLISSPTGQFDGLTLDGGGTGSIVGPDATLNTLEVTGVRSFTAKGLTISGGNDGVVFNGAKQVALDGLTVTGAGRHGIHFQRSSTGFVVNSAIHNNPGNGVVINEDSYVRIGFTDGVGASQGDTGPCTITANGGHGVRVQRSSSARIYTNTVSNNTQDGVHVESASYAEVATNVIDANGKNGVFVSENSALHLGNATGTKNEDNPNSGSSNGAFGLSASWGAYVQGRLDGMAGASGASSFTHAAQNNLTP